MGLCGSSENLSPEEQQKRKAEKERSKALEANLSHDHSTDQAINKLLLLGAGESGKSTLFKQMIQIYGKGYPESERKTFIPIIYNNIITTMKTLCAQTATYAPITDVAMLGIKNYIENELKGDEVIDANLAANISALWLTPEMQEVYKNRAHFHLTDSAAYFNDRIVDVGADGYIPTEQDVLRSRVRTTGIVENEFEIDGNHFKMFDVGGQRNERKKWIHCFENVTAVLFVAAISEYDQMLYEDENTNRIIEALQLFEEICNSRWFKETSMILMLNKRDLFAEKIATVPLDLYFPEYKGGDDLNSARQFMQDLFESKNRNAEKKIYTHVTCATDTGNISAVFNAVRDIIITGSLKSGGLI